MQILDLQNPKHTQSTLTSKKLISDEFSENHIRRDTNLKYILLGQIYDVKGKAWCRVPSRYPTAGWQAKPTSPAPMSITGTPQHTPLWRCYSKLHLLQKIDLSPVSFSFQSQESPSCFFKYFFNSENEFARVQRWNKQKRWVRMSSSWSLKT